MRELAAARKLQTGGGIEFIPVIDPIYKQGYSSVIKFNTRENSLDMNSEVPYPVDEQVLAKTIGGDRNRVREMLGYFILPSRKIITEMNHAFTQHSAVGIKDAAHKLKSSARTIGANSLADVCVVLEDAGKKSDWNVIENNYPLIENLFSDVEVFIKNY